MTKLFDRAVETVRTLSADRQDEIARLVLQFAASEGQPVVPLSPEEEASFGESLAQAAREEFATDEQMRAIWAKHGV